MEPTQISQPQIPQNTSPTVAPTTPVQAPTQAHCNRCHSEVSESFYFCPHCGHKIKEPPYHFSVISAVSILLIAFLFPPFGLIPGFRYLKNKDMRAKMVGILAIVVTAVSFILFIIFLQKYINMMNDTINSINSVSYY